MEHSNAVPSEQGASTTSDTPRTDAVAFSAYVDDITEHPEGSYVSAEFARQLEREVAQWKEAYENYDPEL